MEKKNLLLGSILADAFCLGAHWIYSQRKIFDTFGTYDKLHSPLGDSYHTNKVKGDHTHIGDQTLLLLEFLEKTETFDAIEFKQFWIEKMENYTGYIDHATKGSLILFDTGEEFGVSSNELAGASRIAPIIYHSENEESAVTNAIAQTKVTHNSPNSVLGAEFFTRVTFKVLEGMKPSDAIYSVIETMDNPYLYACIDVVKPLLDSPSRESIKTLGLTCTIDQCMPATIYLILKYENNYKEAMIENVMAGGDSASRGLLSGMVIGLYKPETIPTEWKSEVPSISNFS